MEIHDPWKSSNLIHGPWNTFNFFFHENLMATDEVMKSYFARFISHEMMFMIFSSDFHRIFTNLSFIVYLCNDICKRLVFLVFSDKHEKPLPVFCLKMNLNFPITGAYNDLRFVIQQRVDSTIENQRSVWKIGFYCMCLLDATRRC